jgi:hypothetical protein
MRIIEIFRRGQKPRSRAPPREHNTVVVVSSVPTRHLHRPHPIVIENNDY